MLKLKSRKLSLSRLTLLGGREGFFQEKESSNDKTERRYRKRDVDEDLDADDKRTRRFKGDDENGVTRAIGRETERGVAETKIGIRIERGGIRTRIGKRNGREDIRSERGKEMRERDPEGAGVVPREIEKENEISKCAMADVFSRLLVHLK
ncbi:hypothetical protein RJT34_23323 [Clitoria ternatea]|uniref:Uncharacterized protein n=1 Tax=Clitoria ternatea TaxID=43366 RepID=A0AAN9FKR2_CLITE